jgi:hypothetical protein
MKRACFAVLVAGLLLTAPAGSASVLTFDLVWSATPPVAATGQLMVDNTAWASWIADPDGLDVASTDPGLVGFNMTISGAASGNGSFTKSDFDHFAIWGAGANFDYGQDLVGQPTLGDAWGTPDANSGDFNVFASAPAPDGVFYFVLLTNGGTGDELQLTSFILESGSPVPEPGTLVLVGWGGLALLIRRRSR